jgi:hypothetical protein
MPQLFQAAGQLRPTFDQTKATAADFSAGVGEGLQVAAGAQKEREDFLEQQEERKAGIDREKTVAGDRLWATTRLEELKKELPNGGEGAAEQLKVEAAQRFATQKDTMGTKRAGEDYDLQSTRLMSRIMSDAVVVDAAASARGVAITVGGILDDNRNTVVADPSKAQEAIKQNTRVINDSQLGTVQKEKFLREETEKVWAAAADGLIDPVKVTNSVAAEAAVKELKKKEWRDKLSPKSYASKLTKARKLQADHQGKEWAATRDDINNRLAETSHGASGVTMDPAEANGVSNNPRLVAEYKQKIIVANKEGAWNRRVALANDAQLDQMEATARAEIVEPGGDFKSEIKQLKNVEARQAERAGELNEADRTTVDNITVAVDSLDFTEAKKLLSKVTNKHTRARMERRIKAGEQTEATKNVVETIDTAVSNRDFSDARKMSATISDKHIKVRVNREIDRQEDNVNKDTIIDLAEKIGSGVPNTAVDKKQFDAIHDPQLKKDLKELVAKAEETAAILKIVEKGSEGEVNVLSDMLVAVVNFRGGKEARDELSSLVQARKIRDALIKKDRVGYVTQHSDVVKNAIANHAALNTPASRQELSNVLVSAQERIGIDPRNAYLLTDNQIEAIRHEKLGITDEAKKPEEVYALIQEQRMNAGEDWPRVMKQLTEQDVFAGAELAAAGMQSPGHAQALLVASNLPKEVMNKNLGADFSSIRKEVALSVDGQMADLRPTLANAAGGEAAYATYRDAVHVYALKLVTEGMGKSDAARVAAEEVIMNNYDIEGSVRVPINSGTTAEQTHTVGRLVTQQFLNFSKVVSPSAPAGVQQSVADAAYKKSIQDNGEWVTNGDESGVTLVDEHGNPVLLKDGDKKIELLWSDMGVAALSSVRLKFN